MILHIVWMISFTAVILTLNEFAKGQSVTVAPVSVTIQQLGKYTVNCSTTGFSDAAVTWTKNNQTVSNMTTDRVYQTANKPMYYLLLQNPIFLDEGKYTCLVSDGENRSSSSSIVTVPSQPLISSSEQLSCNGTVQIKWSPHVNSEKLQHRIIAQDGSGFSTTKYITSPSSVESSTISLLAPFQSYNIQISPCGGDICCLNYSSSRNFLHPLPSPQNINISGEENCKISWTRSESLFVNSYELTVTTSYVSVSPRLNVTGTENTTAYKVHATENSHEVRMERNRNYSVEIRASACGKRGPEIRASGRCVSDVSAPSYVEAPNILNTDEYGLSNITLEIPEERNGAISCLFLLVYQDSVNPPNSIDRDYLDSIDEEEEFIALALNLFSLNSSSKTYEFTLGDKTRSSCKLPRADNDVNDTDYDAFNKQIKLYKYFKLVLVSATVSRLLKDNETQDVMFQSSEPIRFWNAPKRDGGSSLVKDAIIGGCMGLLILVAIIICSVRRRIKGKNQPSTSMDYSQSGGISAYTTLPRKSTPQVRTPGRQGTPMKRTASPAVNPKARIPQGGAHTLDRRQNKHQNTPGLGTPVNSYQTLPNRARTAKNKDKVQPKLADLRSENDAKSRLDKRSKSVDASAIVLTSNVDLGVTKQSALSYDEDFKSQKQNSNDVQSDKADSVSMDGSGDLGRPTNALTNM